ncbi:chromophore maturation protein PvdO [Pseudomonas monteilii]|uniref:Chromophore maturation protein PvdO n=1 Tax=Pseudomonas monteilii TaxID=76759 RepID=A0AAE6V3E0_9PSED|nr:chromophore maturation protein PvdO [Pseudomonas monteilii]
MRRAATSPGSPRRPASPTAWSARPEREYAGRAGSTGPFPFPFDQEGEYQISKHANTYGPRDGFTYTAPVGSFPANAFGMYDMHGNVYEWVEDCWHTDYVGAPTDGSAWTTGGTCTHRQIRGNDYLEPPIFSRSGNRNEREPDVRGDWLGFRVARVLQDGEPN